MDTTDLLARTISTDGSNPDYNIKHEVDKHTTMTSPQPLNTKMKEEEEEDKDFQPSLSQESEDEIDFQSGTRMRITRSDMGTFTPKKETRALSKQGRSRPREEPGSPSKHGRKKPKLENAGERKEGEKEDEEEEEREEEKGVQKPIYADGHHLLIRLPRELRSVEDGGTGGQEVTREGILAMLMGGHKLDATAIEFAQRHNRSTWVARFRDAEEARWLDWMNSGYGRNGYCWTCQFSLYRGAGARIFVSGKTNHTPPGVMIERVGARLAELDSGKDVRFWLGLLPRGVEQDPPLAVIWLSRPLETSEFKVKFPVAGGAGGRFVCGFIAGSWPTTECEICDAQGDDHLALTHGMLRCPRIQRAFPAPLDPPVNWIPQLPAITAEDGEVGS